MSAFEKSVADKYIQTKEANFGNDANDNRKKIRYRAPYHDNNGMYHKGKYNSGNRQ